MRKIANFILGTIVCLTVLGIIMFFTLYISLIIANENPSSDDAMFRMIQKTYGVDVTQYSPDVLYKSYDTNIREDYWAMLATVYKGNIIKNLIMDCQSYTKYRPNETTGGIFVSWRRKEELPTGA